MKLYNLQRNTTFRLLEDPKLPPNALTPNAKWVYKLLNIDGMYGNCKGPDKERYYFAAWTEVEPIEHPDNMA